MLQIGRLELETPPQTGSPNRGRDRVEHNTGLTQQSKHKQECNQQRCRLIIKMADGLDFDFEANINNAPQLMAPGAPTMPENMDMIGQQPGNYKKNFRRVSTQLCVCVASWSCRQLSCSCTW